MQVLGQLDATYWFALVHVAEVDDLRAAIQAWMVQQLAAGILGLGGVAHVHLVLLEAHAARAPREVSV